MKYLFLYLRQSAKWLLLFFGLSLSFYSVAEPDPRVLKIKEILLKSGLNSPLLSASYIAQKDNTKSSFIAGYLPEVCLTSERERYDSLPTSVNQVKDYADYKKGCLIVEKVRETGEFQLWSLKEQDGRFLTDKQLFTIKIPEPNDEGSGQTTTENLLAQGLRRALSWETLTDHILTKSPDIILLAETDHYSLAFPEFYGKFIQYVSQQSSIKYDCFLAETDSRYSVAFDRFFEGVSYQKVIGNLHKKLTNEMERTDNRIEEKFSVTEKLAETLKTLGIKIFGFDAIFNVTKGRAYSEISAAYSNSPDDETLHERYVELIYIERNKIMFRNISQIMKESCSKAIAFVGSGYIINNIEVLYPGYKGEPVTALHSQLQATGFQVATIYLVEAEESSPAGFGYLETTYGLGIDAQIYIPNSQSQ